MVHQNTRRDGGVERVDMSLHRERDDDVAFFAHQPRDALALVSDDDGAGARQVAVEIVGAVHVGAVDPYAACFQLVDGFGDVGDARHAHIFNRACARLADRVAEARAAPFGNDHAVHARAFGGADDRAEVVGILQLVENDEEGRLVLFLRVGEDVVERAVILGGGEGDDALMGSDAAEKVELGAVDLLDRDLLFPRLGEDADNSAAFFTLCHHDLVDGTAAAQRFADGISARNHLGFDFFLLFSHSFSSVFPHILFYYNTKKEKLTAFLRNSFRQCVQDYGTFIHINRYDAEHARFVVAEERELRRKRREAEIQADKEKEQQHAGRKEVFEIQRRAVEPQRKQRTERDSRERKGGIRGGSAGTQQQSAAAEKTAEQIKRQCFRGGQTLHGGLHAEQLEQCPEQIGKEQRFCLLPHAVIDRAEQHADQVPVGQCIELLHQNGNKKTEQNSAHFQFCQIFRMLMRHLVHLVIVMTKMLYILKESKEEENISAKENIQIV